MASNNNSSNRMTVPEAKSAMNRFKMEVASELGVKYKRNGSLVIGYNDDDIKDPYNEYIKIPHHVKKEMRYCVCYDILHIHLHLEKYHKNNCI